MIDKLTASQLARCIGVASGYITTAVGRGHLNRDKDKKISLSDPQNILWLQKQEIEHGRKVDLNQITNTKSTRRTISKTRTGNKGVEEEVIINTQASDLSIKKLKAEIAQKESTTRLNQIKEQKAKGELIPFDEAIYILKYTVNEIRESYLQEVDTLINVFKDRLELTHEQYIEIKTDLKESVNAILADAKNKMMENVDTVQKKYSEVLDRGQSKL